MTAPVQIRLTLRHVDGAAYYLALPRVIFLDGRETVYDVWAYSDDGRKLRMVMGHLCGPWAEDTARTMTGSARRAKHRAI